jgi:hypothetical protein
MRANGTFSVKAFNPTSLGDLVIDPDGTHRIWLDYEIGG